MIASGMPDPYKLPIQQVAHLLALGPQVLHSRLHRIHDRRDSLRHSHPNLFQSLNFSGLLDISRTDPSPKYCTTAAGAS